MEPSKGLTASLMMCQVSGTSWSYSCLNARLPGRGAPNVYTCQPRNHLQIVAECNIFVTRVMTRQEGVPS